MSNKLYILLLITNSALVAMEPASPKSTPDGMLLRKLVLDHLDENERKQKAAEPVKDEKYYKKEMSSSFRNLVNTPPAANNAQVMAGPLCIKDNKGVLCAAHSLFVINLIKHQIVKTIHIPNKVTGTDRHEPTPCCVEYAKISGLDEEQVLVGELDGRVLIADPLSHAVKTFGHVPGKVLSFFVNPHGKMIAVRYESKDEAGKPVPCFAVAQRYEPKRSALDLSAKSLAVNLAQSDLSKRRSWAPPANVSKKVWSYFASQSCNHEVKHISFEKDAGTYYCITHCATGTIEKWVIENIDTEPKLVKVAQIEQSKP